MYSTLFLLLTLGAFLITEGESRYLPFPSPSPSPNYHPRQQALERDGEKELMWQLYNILQQKEKAKMDQASYMGFEHRNSIITLIYPKKLFSLRGS